MMSLCKHFLVRKKNSNHSFGLSPTVGIGRGLCLITSGDNDQRKINVVESTAIRSCHIPITFPTEKKDPMGFLDEIAGAVDGLSSCTESLGFESSDQMEEMTVADETKSKSTTIGMNVRKENRENARWRERVKKLPPPLSSLNPNGQSNYFLKSERKNGRLVLTEMSIHRPEIFHASRDNGRLTLQLIERDDEEDYDDLESNVEEDEEEEIQTEVVDEDVRWEIPMTTTGGAVDGFRRCQELSSHHHRHNHHHVPFWNQQQCVTTI